MDLLDEVVEAFRTDRPMGQLSRPAQLVFLVPLVLSLVGMIAAIGYAVVAAAPGGVQGFVHHVSSFEEASQIWLRLNWEEIEKIGSAVMVPEGFKI